MLSRYHIETLRSDRLFSSLVNDLRALSLSQEGGAAVASAVGSLRMESFCRRSVRLRKKWRFINCREAFLHSTCAPLETSSGTALLTKAVGARKRNAIAITVSEYL